MWLPLQSTITMTSSMLLPLLLRSRLYRSRLHWRCCFSSSSEESGQNAPELPKGKVEVGEFAKAFARYTKETNTEVLDEVHLPKTFASLLRHSKLVQVCCLCQNCSGKSVFQVYVRWGINMAARWQALHKMRIISDYFHFVVKNVYSSSCSRRPPFREVSGRLVTKA